MHRKEWTYVYSQRKPVSFNFVQVILEVPTNYCNHLPSQAFLTVITTVTFNHLTRYNI